MDGGGLRHHAPDQRLVLGRQRARSGRAVPGRRPARPGGGGELGRLGPVLHRDVRAARRAWTPPRSRCATASTLCGGRVGAREAQRIVAESTIEFVIANRDEHAGTTCSRTTGAASRTRRAPSAARRRSTSTTTGCSSTRRPTSSRAGAGQRSDAGGEPPRRVDAVQRDRGRARPSRRTPSTGRRSRRARTSCRWRRRAAGWRTRPCGSASTSPTASAILYAPPAAWSHGYLWGADVVTIDRGTAFSPQTNEITKPSMASPAGSSRGQATAYALEIDSPTAVRDAQRLCSPTACRRSSRRRP